MEYGKAEFKDRLCELLIIKNISASELSRITGVSKSSISHYLKGHWDAKQDVIYKIASACNVRPEWLMGFDVPAEIENSTTAKSNDADKFDPIDYEIVDLILSLSAEKKQAALSYLRFLSNN